MHALAVSMGVPTVGFWMTIPSGFIMGQTMQPTPPSYVPNYMSAYSDRMSFFQRVHNTIWSFLAKLIGDFHIKGTCQTKNKRQSQRFDWVNVTSCIIPSHLWLSTKGLLGWVDRTKQEVKYTQPCPTNGKIAYQILYDSIM